MNLDQKVKCPECYFIFKNDSARKYINCPECKAELNQKDLTVIPEESTKAAPKSIFGGIKTFLLISIGILFLSTGCGQKIINKSIEKISGDSELIQITRDLYAVVDQSGFANSGFYINPKGSLLIDARFTQKQIKQNLDWLKKYQKNPNLNVLFTSSEGPYVRGAQFIASANFYAQTYLLYDLNFFTPNQIETLIGKMDLSQEVPLIPSLASLKIKTFNEKFNLDRKKKIVAVYPGEAKNKPNTYILFKRSGVLFTGSLFSNGVIPDITGASLNAWIAVTKKMIETKPKVIVPGYGNLASLNDLKKFNVYLLKLNEISAGLQQGMTLPALKNQVLFDEFVTWNAFEKQHAVNLDYLAKKPEPVKEITATAAPTAIDITPENETPKTIQNQ